DLRRPVRGREGRPDRPQQVVDDLVAPRPAERGAEAGGVVGLEARGADVDQRLRVPLPREHRVGPCGQREEAEHRRGGGDSLHAAHATLPGRVWTTVVSCNRSTFPEMDSRVRPSGSTLPVDVNTPWRYL